MASKRSRQEGEQEEPEVEEGEERVKKRKVEFQDVRVFRFDRRQGYVCVPSQVRLLGGWRLDRKTEEEEKN